MTRPGRSDGVSDVAARRHEQRARILAATRALFDAEGRCDASVTDIARVAGVNRAILYKYFMSREEISALVLADHLDDLHELLSRHDDPRLTPTDRLRHLTVVFYEHAVAHPGFIECARSLLRLSNEALDENIGPEALRAVGRSMTRLFAIPAAVLDAGVASAEFTAQDTGFVVNLLYNQALGALNLARLDPWVLDLPSAMPQLARTDFREAIPGLVDAALAIARGSTARAAGLEKSESCP